MGNPLIPTISTQDPTKKEINYYIVRSVLTIIQISHFVALPRFTHCIYNLNVQRHILPAIPQPLKLKGSGKQIYDFMNSLRIYTESRRVVFIAPE